MRKSTNRIAIQGELGSNSHMAALAKLRDPANLQIVPCAMSSEVFERVVSGDVDGAVIPIENSLHGSVAEHYDLLLQSPVQIVRESLARISHNVIAAPGVPLSQVRRVLSHPVALSQCRKWLGKQALASRMEAVPFYDTAGAVKHIMEHGLKDAAAIAPPIAAEVYGAEILVPGIEDHTENFTRFYLIQRLGTPGPNHPNKLSVAFSVEHRPGTLLMGLEEFRSMGLNLTRIESRPVPGKPWEYVFYVDVRYETPAQVETALKGLHEHSNMVKELGRYPAA